MENQIEELTSKNKDYVHSVTKQLMLAGKSDAQVKEILADIIPQIIEGQKTGQLAKKLLGTPSEFVEKYNDKKVEAANVKADQNENPVLMWLDSALLFLGFILILNGVMGIFSPHARIYGVTMALAMSLFAGLVMYLVYRFFYSRVGKQEKFSLKGIIAVVIAVIVWLLITMGAGMLPAQFNPQLNAYVSLVIGLVALGVKYLLKRQFNIRSAMAPVPRAQQRK